MAAWKMRPSTRKPSVQISAATRLVGQEARFDMPRAPAIGGATTDTPGTNLAAISDRPPQRPRMDSLRRTQESADSEMRHSSRITR